MALTDLDVVYDDKAFGGIIDPTQWNANFKLIETVMNGNNAIVNGHLVNFINPHQVTKVQVGLGNVDDVKQATKVDFDSHVARVDNPHTVTKTQVGLGNVDDVKQATKAEHDSHTARTDNPHSVTAAQTGAYTKTEMQTSGQSQLHWGNLTNKPNFADASWKTAVANRAALPLTGNTINDQRVVLDDGDGKQAMYVCIATTGLVDAQWDKIGDVDWTNDHGNMVGLGDDDHTQYHNDTRGDARYYTKTQSDDALHNRAGAVVKELEIVTTAGQTALNISAIGSYLVGEKTLSVFKKGVTDRYEKLDRDDYVETSTTVATLNTPALNGDIYLLSWFENTPELISSYARKDGTVQTNLNADLLDGQEGNYYARQLDIDSLLGTKNATITTTWVGASAPYTQEIAVVGVTANDEPTIYPVYSTTNATAILQRTAWNFVDKIETGTNKIICTCFEDKPLTAIPVQIKGV